jgi:hypothetical protein
MPSSEQLFVEIGLNLPCTEHSQMFGKPCFKINKKVFVCFFKDCKVFKLKDTIHQDALGGTKLFDPSGKGRPMKEWVQIPFEHQSKWQAFVEVAYLYIQNSEK